MMEKKTKYRIFVGILSVFLLSLGVMLGLTLSYKSNVTDGRESYHEEDIAQDDDVNVYQGEPVSTKTYDIELVYIDFYKLCGERIQTTDTIYGTKLDDLKQKEATKQKEAGKTYQILEETNERLVFEREIEQNCPNHFNVTLDNGKIMIYNVVSDAVSTIYKTIDIPQELIRPEMLEELNVGIKVNSKEELNLLIEDLES